MRKYKKINGKTRAAVMLQSIIDKKPNLFAHWKLGNGATNLRRDKIV